MTAPPTRRLYGRRKGKRLRPGQERLLRTLLPSLAVALPATGESLDPARLFDPRPQAVWLEIGFGGGEHLAALARPHPELGFIGCEPFVNGVVKLLAEVERGRLDHVRIYPDDARPLLEGLAPASIGCIAALFPDPWPKQRHHKRRLVQDETIELFARALADGAELRLATDDADYASWIIEHMAAHSAFEGPAGGPGGLPTRPADWPPTRYEAKALRRGARPVYLLYRRRPRG